MEKVLKIINIFSYFILFILIIFTFNFDIIQVNGNSMNPTLTDGDIGIVQKTKYIKDDDIIMIKTDDRLEVDYIIKRYIDGLSTETQVYVLGDNRSNSLDSRKLGTFNRDCVSGKLIVYYSKTQQRFVFL